MRMATLLSRTGDARHADLLASKRQKALDEISAGKSAICSHAYTITATIAVEHTNQPLSSS